MGAGTDHMTFVDRADAGRRLAEALSGYRDHDDVVVLGLPRGGVPVAFEVAAALHAPLDVLVVRKLGVPFQPELAMGAIGEGGVRVLNDDVLQHAELDTRDVDAVEAREREELARRVERYRGGHPHRPLQGRTVIIVDDGVATGATAKAACQVARAHGAARVVLAVPVAAPSSVEELQAVADEVVAVESPSWLSAVGQSYQHFAQTSDDEVMGLLGWAARLHPPAGVGADPDEPSDRHEEVLIPAEVVLEGRLSIPAHARAVVLFAHGSGSGRHSPRNRFVADVLNRAGFATLLFDLLDGDAELRRADVFDVELLGGRLVAATGWARGRPELRGLPVVYVGASTGAAAALWAAAEQPGGIAAVVSRGGRPDLAHDRLAAVTAPTLLIVGGADEQVLELNRQAASELRCEHEVAVVPGATHLFDEPGTLALAASLTRNWLLDHLG